MRKVWLPVIGYQAQSIRNERICCDMRLLRSPRGRIHTEKSGRSPGWRVQITLRGDVMDRIVKSIRDVYMGDLNFPVIAVYAHPVDYPDKYVARIFDLNKPTNTAVIKRSLEDLQEDIVRNRAAAWPAIWFPRAENDDPCLVGCWL